MSAKSTVIAICLPIVIFLTNFLALSFSDFIYKSYFTSSEDLHYAMEAVDFVKLDRELDPEYFSDQARLHMADVRGLYNKAKAANAVLVLILFATVIRLVYTKRFGEIKKGMVGGLIVATLFILTIFSLTLISFDQSFVVFHKIIFTNNLWIFPEEDTLVKLFSLDFFTYFLEKLTTNILITMLVTMVLTKLILKNVTKSS